MIMEYKIDFKHGMIDGDDKRFTHCYILKKDNDEEGWYFLTEGRAYCNPKDNFSYEKGRRVSLTKALAPLWKEVRTKLWKQYFDEKLSARMTSKDHEFAQDLKDLEQHGAVMMDDLRAGILKTSPMWKIEGTEGGRIPMPKPQVISSIVLESKGDRLSKIEINLV